MSHLCFYVYASTEGKNFQKTANTQSQVKRMRSLLVTDAKAIPFRASNAIFTPVLEPRTYIN